MRDPSGDHAACIAAPAPRVNWRSAPLARSRIHTFIDPPRSEEYASDLPSGDHAGSASTHASRVRRCGAPPTGIVHRSPSADECHLRTVRRHGRVHDPARRLRARQIEVLALRRERRTRERHVGRELDDARGAAGGGPALDLAVGGVEQFGRRRPLRPERKHVLVGVGDVAAAADCLRRLSCACRRADHQPAAAAGDDAEGDRRTVGRKGWSGDVAARCRHQSLGRRR